MFYAVPMNMAIAVALLYLSMAAMACKIKLWKVFIMDICTVPIGLPVIFGALVYGILEDRSVTSMPLPVFSGFLSSTFYAYTAWAMCVLLLMPHGNETRKPSDAIAVRLLVTFVPSLTAPCIVYRWMPPKTYYALIGFIHIAYVLSTIVLAVMAFQQLGPLPERRPPLDGEPLPENESLPKTDGGV